MDASCDSSVEPEADRSSRVIVVRDACGERPSRRGCRQPAPTRSRTDDRTDVEMTGPRRVLVVIEQPDLQRGQRGTARADEQVRKHSLAGEQLPANPAVGAVGLIPDARVGCDQPRARRARWYVLLRTAAGRPTGNDEDEQSANETIVSCFQPAGGGIACHARCCRVSPSSSARRPRRLLFARTSAAHQAAASALRRSRRPAHPAM